MKQLYFLNLALAYNIYITALFVSVVDSETKRRGFESLGKKANLNASFN